MKRFLIPCLLLSMVFTHSTAKSLVLTLSNGGRMYYLLGGETNPMMRFSGSEVTVETDSYELSGIKHFAISEQDDPNGIERVMTNEHISYANGLLVVPTAEVDHIKVYHADGAEVKALVTRNASLTTISLAHLPKGVYVVHTGHTSLKLMKK